MTIIMGFFGANYALMQNKSARKNWNESDENIVFSNSCIVVSDY